MQGNEELKKRQILSAQIDLSKFNKGDFIKSISVSTEMPLRWLCKMKSGMRSVRWQQMVTMSCFSRCDMTPMGTVLQGVVPSGVSIGIRMMVSRHPSSSSVRGRSSLSAVSPMKPSGMPSSSQRQSISSEVGCTTLIHVCGSRVSTWVNCCLGR